jgi:hypothetical protein
MGAESFRRQLQLLLDERGWTIPQLANKSGYHRGYLWELATGRSSKRPSRTLVEDLDQALSAGGTLIMAMEGGDNEVDRRQMLRDLGTLALVAPLAGVESFRQDLTHAVGGADLAGQWAEIVGEYAQTFYLTTPDALLRDLLVDLSVVQGQLSGSTEPVRGSLSRVAGQLAAITAMAWASIGQPRQARRWWSTARQATDASGDTAARVWVRGWEVANGLYERRPIAVILDRAAEARAIAGDRADAGTAGLYAGLAQTLAVAGHPDAVSTLHRVADITSRVDAAEAADNHSMFGWPEVRLRHTESYVYTAIGDTARAYAAQDAALALYGSDLAREHAAMLLHRARCMIIDGDVSGGVGYAHQVLDDLPAEHHTDLVFAVAHDALRAVPPPDRRLAAVAGLRDRLAPSEKRA